MHLILSFIPLLHIERNNLTLSTRIKRLARKTICFSRSI
ncbi:IS1 family transposase [Aeromonas allosaccharophila]